MAGPLRVRVGFVVRLTNKRWASDVTIKVELNFARVEHLVTMPQTPNVVTLIQILDK